jgi:renalase
VRSRVLVVGAGAAGLCAAGRLQDAGASVVVVDKGRGVGGRLATRRVGAARIDHGAQFFTARSATMRDQAERWVQNGVARIWCHGFRQPEDGHPRYVGATGMTSLAKDLARHLDVRTGIHVSGIHIEPDSRYGVTIPDVGAALDLGGFDAVVLTPPVPQTLALLHAGRLVLPDADRSALERIRYDPTVSALAVLAGPSEVPSPGGVQLDPSVTGTPITWVGDNLAKGISPIPAVTVHAAAQLSLQRWDDDPGVLAAALVELARPWIGSAPLTEVQLMRWRYATPTVLHDEPRLRSRPAGAVGPLVVAGDAFGQARVEGAILSGAAAADAVIEAL